MKKIATIFERDWAGDRSRVNSQPTEAHKDLSGAVATVKHDGTAVMVRKGLLFKRYDCKKRKTPPPGFIPAQDKDEKTGHWPGWILADPEKPEDKWFFTEAPPVQDGTYEFCGPKVNGNPQGYAVHCFKQHGGERLDSAPTDYGDLIEYLAALGIEGIVWWRGGQPVGKIKSRDLKLPWPLDNPDGIQ